MSEIVYSSQRTDFQKGRVYQNPRFFDGVVQMGITSVIVVGDWPRVVATYEEAGIPVYQVGVGEELPRDTSGNGGSNDDDSGSDDSHDETAPVEIPSDDELDGMNYRDLRKLVNRIDAQADISSKRDAIKFLKSHRQED